jgi:hypothetical protein
MKRNSKWSSKCMSRSLFVCGKCSIKKSSLATVI